MEIHLCLGIVATMPMPDNTRTLSLLLFLGLAACATTVAQAQSTAHDGQIRAAIEAAEQGRFDAAHQPALVDHPLYGWVQYASLTHELDTLPAARAQTFLARYRGQAVAESFRKRWLSQLAKRKDWAGFRAAWSPQIDDTDLRCNELQARAANNAVDASWIKQAQTIWLSSGESLPGQCDPVFDTLAARGQLTPELRWQRLLKAAAEGATGVMQVAARGLPVAEQALAQEYAAFIVSPNPSALTWPKTKRSALVASYGLARLARHDPDRAEALLPQYAKALDFSEQDRGRVLYMIALWTVASYLPESERRLQAVPDASYDERLRAWQVRGALARSDWSAALAAIHKMSATQRNDSRYEYFEARLAELTGDSATAQAKYAAAAREAEFHGFLAADRLGQAYALCPLQPKDSAAMETAVANDPALIRAMALYRIDRPGWAVREWHDALSRFDDSQRRIAVEIAQANGWFDRAVFSLARDKPEERHFYYLRFPLHHDAIIRREAAKNRLDPAWVAAEIRAESVFNPNARSPANARGLMQVLPTTGEQIARRQGLPWGGASSLYQPETNIVLGTAYLRHMLDKFGGQPYFAMAGYNAGPSPLARWQADRPGMDPDFWIETISYHETRDYVARVLAFSVIYDWRLNGDALRMTDRMRGRVDGPRKEFSCPAAAAP